MTRQKLVLETIPDWAIDSDARDRHTISAAFELAGLTGKRVRLAAASQRALFGYVMFGKRQIRVASDGIHGQRTACFGTDFSTIHLSWEEVERYLANQYQPIW